MSKHPYYIPGDPHHVAGSEPEENGGPERPSKSQKKRDMHALQDLGAELIALSAERLARMNLPEALLEAIKAAQRIKAHEARRRQLQLVGKLMRGVDPEPIRALLDAFNGASREETARMHRLEKLRADFLANETVLTDIMNRYPGADSQHLRTLRRNALRESEQGKPPRSFRELFRVLRDLDDASA